MTKTLAMFHTGPVVIKPLNDLARTAFPEIKVVNCMDDGIVPAIEAAGSMTPAIRERICSHLLLLVRQGVDGLLVTCSSISPAVDIVRQLTEVPILKIDEPMAELAVKRGRKIGVIATLRTTLLPSVSLIQEKANRSAVNVEISQELCRTAFDFLQSGNTHMHDEIVVKSITKLVREVDVIVLAQASMARLIPSLPRDLQRHVLSSPESGIRRAAQALGFEVPDEVSETA